MNETVNWLTVLELEKETNIPNATIRRYIRKHGHHINLKKKGKSYLITKDSIKILLDIRRYYEDGKSLLEVEDLICDQKKPLVIDVDLDGKQTTLDLGKAFEELKKEMSEQREVIKTLANQLNDQQKYIENKIEERDKILLEALRETQKKKEMIIDLKKKRWYQIWK